MLRGVALIEVANRDAARKVRGYLYEAYTFAELIRAGQPIFK